MGRKFMDRIEELMTEMTKELLAEYARKGYNSNPDHVWALAIVEEAGEVAKALLERQSRDDLREEIIDVIVAGLAWLEDFDRCGSLT
jgi:NTP pyrophosphatase (non-canonical NTP hydrolase)